jgi:hypothetical protein
MGAFIAALKRCATPKQEQRTKAKSKARNNVKSRSKVNKNKVKGTGQECPVRISECGLRLPGCAIA